MEGSFGLNWGTRDYVAQIQAPNLCKATLSRDNTYVKKVDSAHKPVQTQRKRQKEGPG